MQDGCKVDMDYSYTTSNGSCFMVTWMIFKTRLLEVGLTQNGDTMALCNVTIIELWYILSCVRALREQKIIERAFGFMSGHV